MRQDLSMEARSAFPDMVFNERTDYITLNDKPVTLPICAVFELESGRIKAWREYFDTRPARAAYGSSK
jgi:limonene-1,2-epoxide hydrolase